MNKSSADCIMHLFIWRSKFRHSGSSTRWDQDRPRLLDSLRDNVFVWAHDSVVTWSNHPCSAQRTVYCFEQQHNTYESTGVPLKAKSQTCMPRLADETMEQLNCGWRPFLHRLCEEILKMLLILFEHLQKISNSTKFGGYSLKTRPAMPILSLKYKCL